MQSKSIILRLLSGRTLKRIVDALRIDVDRRSAEAMRAALSRSRRVVQDNLLPYMLTEEIKALCGRLGLPVDGRREELLERVKSLQDSVTEGLDDGSRIRSHKGGWGVVGRNGLFLADPNNATWVMSPNVKEIPPAVFPSAAEAYLAWMQSQAVARDRSLWVTIERSQSIHGM